MHIDSKSEIAGLPALLVRDFLKKSVMVHYSIEGVMEYFGISKRAAQKVVKELLGLGYLKEDTFHGEKYWGMSGTKEVCRLVNASGAPPITRKTAERKLKEFLARVEEVNRDDGTEFGHKITRVALFGSYLTDAERVNDIDIGVEMASRKSDPEEQINHELELARKSGRRFSTFLEELAWASVHVRQFLKARSRSYSIHEFSEMDKLGVKYKVIHEKK